MDLEAKIAAMKTATIPATREAVMDFLKQGILDDMRSSAPSWAPHEWFFPFSYFTCDHVSRDVIRGVLRQMVDEGLCEYRAGLFTEEGMTAGSGYGITRKGNAWLTARIGEDN